MPQPRKARASMPATPASKRASAAGPPSLYLHRVQCVGFVVLGRGVDRAWAFECIWEFENASCT